MKDVEYFAVLRRIETRLAPFVNYVSVDEPEDCPFLFAENGVRAMHMEMNDDPCWWMEFWERSDEEDIPHVVGSTASSEEQAFQSALNWLTDKKESG